MVVNEAHLGNTAVTNISRSFTHKMATKTGLRRYGMKLRHCHPVQGLY